MYNTTAEYKTEIKKPSRSFECKITIGDRIFTNDDIVDIKLDGNIQPSDSFMIGSTTSQTLDLILINKGDTIYSTNQIKVEIGLKVGSKIEYIPMGLYNIDDVVKTDYTIKFTAFDNMIKFETAYFSSLGGDPTLQQVVNELASKTGVPFIGTLPSYTVKKLEGFTCREILSYVASVCGGNATITRDGKFTIVYPKEVSCSITGDNYIDLKREEVKYKLGKVTCQNKEKETISKGSLGTDSMELLFENPWVTETILTDIYNRLNGFEYLGYSMKWQGDISLDIGDIITVTDVKGVVRKLPILNQKFTYTGGLISEISAKGESKNKNNFSSSGNNSNKVDRVVTDLALVNKAFVDYAHINDADITDLKAETAKIGDLEVETANINNLLAGNIGAGNVQTIHLTGKNVVIDEAVIKDLIAKKITVGDLLAGNIDANRFNIVGSNGNLTIKDNTIQIKDGTRARVQIGKDASGDYSMYVWDATGKLMFDATGLKADGIKNKIIRDDMISDTANINGKKLNIDSLVTEVNKDTNTQLIKGSKVAIDLEGQSLDVAFKSLKSNVDSKESRNLILNGDFNNSLTSWNKNGGMSEVIKEGERNVLRLYANDSSGNRGVNQTITTGDIKTNENYTLSLMCKKGKLAGAFKYYIWYLDNNGAMISSTNKDISVTNEYSKLIETFKVPNNDNIKSLKVFIYCQEFTPTELFIYDIKIEKGININPVYSKAPEDVDSSMQALQTSITTNIEGIKTLVKDTTITKEGKDIKLKDAYSSLEQNVGSITQRVESVETMKIGVNNLLVNSGFETGNLTGWNFREWRNIGSVNSGFDLSSSTTKYYLLGKHTPFLNAANVVNTEVGGVLEYGKLVPVKPNTQYVLSFYRAVFRGKVTQEHSFRDATGKELGYIINGATEIIDEANRITKTNITDDLNTNETPINGSIFKRVVLKFTTPPSCTQLKIMSVLQYSYSDAYYFMDNVQLVEGNKITDWVPNIEEIKEIADTSKSNIDNMFSDNKITPLEKKELKKEWDSIVKNYASNLSLATTLKANTTDYTAKYNALVTAVSGIFTDMTATTERNLTNLRTAFVNYYDVEQALLNSLTGGIGNRVSTAEQKITPTAITQAVSSNIQSGGQIHTTSSIMDLDGFTVLDNGNKSVRVSRRNSIDFYDWTRPGDILVGAIVSTENTSSQVRGVDLTCYAGKYVSLSYKKNNDDNSNYHVMKVWHDSPTDVGGVTMSANLDFNDYRIERVNGINYNLPAGKKLWIHNFRMEENTFDINYKSAELCLNYWRGSLCGNKSASVLVLSGNNDAQAGKLVCGDFNSYGSKNSIQETQSYGDIAINAYEVADYYFGDIGSGKLESGVCVIDIDPILAECINTSIQYQVFITKYGEGDIWVEERESTYFIVKGTKDIKFGWELKAKRKGYENNRLERIVRAETLQPNQHGYDRNGVQAIEEFENEIEEQMKEEYNLIFTNQVELENINTNLAENLFKEMEEI